MTKEYLDPHLGHEHLPQKGSVRPGLLRPGTSRTGSSATAGLPREGGRDCLWGRQRQKVRKMRETQRNTERVSDGEGRDGTWQGVRWAGGQALRVTRRPGPRQSPLLRGRRVGTEARSAGYEETLVPTCRNSRGNRAGGTRSKMGGGSGEGGVWEGDGEGD